MSISLTSGLWIVLGLLSITAVALIVLMFMMLIGRKGVTHATVLSFVVSVLAHLGFVCAWFAWYIYTELHPGPHIADAEELPPQTEAVQIQDVLTAAEEPFSAQEAGNDDLEEFTEKTTASPLERYKPPPQELTEIDDPDRMTVETDVFPPVEIPDAPSNPERPPSIPKLRQEGETGPITASQIPMEVESPERQARPEVMIPDTPLERTPSPFVAQEDAPVERSQQTGAVNKIEIDPEPVKATPDLVEDPEATIAKTDLDGFSELAGPTPTLVEDPKLGTAADSDSSEGKTSDSPRKKIDRTRLSNSTGAPGESLMRERPSLSPSIPTPTNDGAEVTPTIPDLDFPAIGSDSPNVVRPDINMPLERPEAGIPETYRLRSLENRADTARKYGGTEETEQAVEKSLAWLAAHQHRDGYWDADRYGSGLGPADDVEDLNLPADRKQIRRESGVQADTGVTALSLLAFLAAGYTNEEGQYAENVDRAIRWLIEEQRGDGYLGGDATYFAGVYCHAMVTYALAEALGMQSDPNTNRELKQAVTRGVAYSLRTQISGDGGWRYTSQASEGDMSIFGWQLMALKSADIAGIKMPDDVKTSLINFLRRRSLGENHGLAAYRTGEPPNEVMTAEALFCKQILGIRRGNPQSTEAVEYLLNKPPKIAEWNLYYWYYGTLAMYQYGGAEWDQWNAAMRDALTTTQESRGSNAGSWDPVGPWGPYGGRVYSTALATLCLEVYYRFLPLYEHGGRFEK
jgi:hypothetical protein